MASNSMNGRTVEAPALEMRVRVMTALAFTGDKVIGAILSCLGAEQTLVPIASVSRSPQ